MPVWTYDEALVEGKDTVRFLVGDTDQNDQLTQDEEIVKMLGLYPASVEGKPYLAAAATADAIAGRFARKFQRSVGPLSGQFQQQFEHYRELAAHLRMIHQTGGLGVEVSGVVKAAIPRLGGGGPTYLGADD